MSGTCSPFPVNNFFYGASVAQGNRDAKFRQKPKQEATLKYVGLLCWGHIPVVLRRQPTGSIHWSALVNVDKLDADPVVDAGIAQVKFV